MPDESTSCTGDLTTVFPAPPQNADKKYRFFNQPIEQIPGYVGDQPQILVHRPDSGLQWFTLDMCLPVVTCMTLEEDKIKVNRRSVVVIKDFDIPNDDACDIVVTACPAPS
jgi:hypothetical protein